MTDEAYLALHAPHATSAAEAVTGLRAQLGEALRERGLGQADVVLLRFFCSDVYNQAPVIDRLWPEAGPCQRICIGQRPLDSAYISLQAYALRGVEKSPLGPGCLSVRHGGYASLWLLEYPTRPGSSEAQTDEILDRLAKRLGGQRMTVAGNVLRTWYYLRDIDNTYAGMIKSRVRHYEAAGLTPETHFIASTGIEGRSPDPHALVALHAHAVSGLAPGQVRYLRALDHLSPTSFYGVNFERATLVSYGDRKHCHISGTASIDAEGNVLHKGDVVRQLGRTLENMAALLAEGGMRMADLAAATVYLRDGADAPRITAPLFEALPALCAVNINHGAVCRPDWLIEIEAEAICPQSAPFASFMCKKETNGVSIISIMGASMNMDTMTWAGLKEFNNYHILIYGFDKNAYALSEHIFENYPDIHIDAYIENSSRERERERERERNCLLTGRMARFPSFLSTPPANKVY